MYKVIKDFRDILRDRHEYKVGDVYEELYPKWTQHLVDTGYIQKVEKKKIFGKDENVTEKQD